MTMEAGTYARLNVAREVGPYGFFLSDGERDVLLPYAEKIGEVKVGETVEVYLFYDTQDRLAATMRKPLLALGEVALLEVVDIHPRFGIFLDMGLGRNLLFPYREQPELPELRPVVGDRVYVVLRHDRQGRLVAKAAVEEDLAAMAVRAPESWKNEWKQARVYKPLQMGTFVIVEPEGPLGFGAIGMIHATERAKMYRLGEAVDVRVTFVREDGRVNLSTRAIKEVGREEDADRILAYLKERPNGAMPFSDQTPADIISSRFQLSKGAFKRALGKLMKDGLVYQKENWTYLREPENPE